MIAVTNPGGIRADLVKKREDGTVTYGDIFAAQPFLQQSGDADGTAEELDTMSEAAG